MWMLVPMNISKSLFRHRMRQSCGRVAEQDAPFFFKLNHLNLVVTNCKRRETFIFCYSKSSHGISDSEALWFLGGGVGWLNEQAVFRVKLRKSSA